MTTILLQLFRDHYRHWLTMEALRVELKIAPAQILDHIEQLRRLGYQIETTPAYGFRLASWQGPLNLDIIEHKLNTRLIGTKTLLYQDTNSTNDVAWNHAAAAGYDGLAVFAEQQRKGRGRLGRAWDAPSASSVLCSVLLQNVTSLRPQALTLLAGLSVAEAVDSCHDLAPQIKWPNDIIVQGKKLAGIMIETRRLGTKTAAVIGIGLNARQTTNDFPPELRTSARSLAQLTNADIDRINIARAILQCLDHWLVELAAGRTDKLHDQWLNRCAMINQRLTLICDKQRFTGLMIDVSIHQGLLLRLDNGSIKNFDPNTTTVEIT